MTASKLESQRVCEESRIFSGRTAWFSTSVSAQVKYLWITNAGLVRGCHIAQYLFSDDPNAKDTIGFYRSNESQLDSRLTIFTSQWIKDAVKDGSLCDIAFAHYILGEPNEEAYDSKKALDGFTEDEIWNFVDETNMSIRSLKEFRHSQSREDCDAVKNQGQLSPQRRQRFQNSKGVKKSTTNNQLMMYDGFIHIDDVKLDPDKIIEDFIPNSNGYKVRLK